MERGSSFLALLVRKLAAVERIQSETGANMGAAIKEVGRQITQTSPKRDGNPITGKGVTKSGPED